MSIYHLKSNQIYCIFISNDNKSDLIQVFKKSTKKLDTTLTEEDNRQHNEGPACSPRASHRAYCSNYTLLQTPLKLEI